MCSLFYQYSRLCQLADSANVVYFQAVCAVFFLVMSNLLIADMNVQVIHVNGLSIVWILTDRPNSVIHRTISQASYFSIAYYEVNLSNAIWSTLVTSSVVVTSSQVRVTSKSLAFVSQSPKTIVQIESESSSIGIKSKSETPKSSSTPSQVLLHL